MRRCHCGHTSSSPEFCSGTVNKILSVTPCDPVDKSTGGILLRFFIPYFLGGWSGARVSSRCAGRPAPAARALTSDPLPRHRNTRATSSISTLGGTGKAPADLGVAWGGLEQGCTIPGTSVRVVPSRCGAVAVVHVNMCSRAGSQRLILTDQPRLAAAVSQP